MRAPFPVFFLVFRKTSGYFFPGHVLRCDVHRIDSAHPRVSLFLNSEPPYEHDSPQHIGDTELVVERRPVVPALADIAGILSPPGQSELFALSWRTLLPESACVSEIQSQNEQLAPCSVASRCNGPGPQPLL